MRPKSGSSGLDANHLGRGGLGDTGTLSTCIGRSGSAAALYSGRSNIEYIEYSTPPFGLVGAGGGEGVPIGRKLTTKQLDT